MKIKFSLRRLVFDPPDEAPLPKGFTPDPCLIGSSAQQFLDLSEADVPGRIGEPRFFSFWKDVLKAPAEILEIVRNGYTVPFINGILPPPAFAPNNKSALDKADFLLDELHVLDEVLVAEPVLEEAAVNNNNTEKMKEVVLV